MLEAMGFRIQNRSLPYAQTLYKLDIDEGG